ncbi:OB-fold domain-containing protein [Actinoplanes sp. NBRC 103695]|uniref:Zn-ribbon domain-containing OB-fold protein n=1 Tax=Actinoplanes sp. NBRC 103695 TaxID=3032202 RepID=UPI002554C86B|nr:OB-fold domain-containing protein [Actinoplanes sp. NBRC 103695]
MVNPPNRHDPELEPFWDGTEKDELRVQRCSACGAVRWPPRPACFRCGGLEVGWVPAAGCGELYSWTVVARSTLPDFADQVPYVVGVVALEGLPVRVIGRVETDDPWGLQVGIPVTVAFRDHASGVRLPVWLPRARPVGGATGPERRAM